MSDAFTTLEADIAAARDLIAAENWAAAYNRLVQAKATLSAMPTGAYQSTSVDMDRRAIDELLAIVRRNRNATIGFQRTDIAPQTESGSGIVIR